MTGKLAFNRMRWALLIPMILILVTGGTALAAEFAGGDEYRLPAGERIDDDLYVSAGEIYIEGEVTGDLYAAGGYIEVSGVVGGDIVAAGGGLVVSGQVGDDVRLAGGGIDIRGTIGDDLIVAGGGGQGVAFPMQMGSRTVRQGVRIDSSANVGGDGMIVGGEALLDGRVAGDLFVGAGVFELRGEVLGDAEIRTSQMQISEGGRIGGTLTYTSDQEGDVPAGAADSVRYEAPQREEEGTSIIATLIGWMLRTLAVLVGISLLGWLLLRFAPGLLERPVEAIEAGALESILWGLGAAALLIFIPLASVIIVAAVWTFWGIFPGLVTFLFLFATLALIWFFSPLVTGLWLGRQIGEQINLGGGALVSLLVGALLIVLLGRVPILGWLVYLLSFLLALGGMLRWTQIKNRSEMVELAPVE